MAGAYRGRDGRTGQCRGPRRARPDQPYDRPAAAGPRAAGRRRCSAPISTSAPARFACRRRPARHLGNDPMRMTRRLSLPAFLIAIFVCLVGTAPAALAIDIKRVVSPGGIEAWLVQDTKVPLLSIKFVFKGGVETDPVGKQGLANLASTLLDEGAGPYDSQEFQRRLADNSISVSFTATMDGFYGGLHTLVETQDEAFDLARLALTKPRFDDEAVERMRRGVLTEIRRDQGDPDFLAR